MNLIFLYIWTFFTILRPCVSFRSESEFSEYDDRIDENRPKYISSRFCFNVKDRNCGPKSPAWGGKCQTGLKQSPIDINTLGNTQNFGIVKFGKTYTQSVDHFYIRNNGQSVQLHLPEHVEHNFTISGSGLKGTYIYGTSHFHWGLNDNEGSEHTIDGNHAHLELHLIHYSNRFKDLKDAKNSADRDALAVMGILFKIGNTENPQLQKIIEFIRHTDKSPTEEYNKIDEDFNIIKLIPDPYTSEERKIFKYFGSLTTPPCSENVVWFVFKDPVIISRQQIEAFRGLVDENGEQIEANIRPLQPLGDRQFQENYAEFS